MHGVRSFLHMSDVVDGVCDLVRILIANACEYRVDGRMRR